MNEPRAFPDKNGYSLSPDAVGDLRRVAKSLEALEVQLCILSVQMQYDQSTFSLRAVDLARDVGEIHEMMENILTFGI